MGVEDGPPAHATDDLAQLYQRARAHSYERCVALAPSVSGSELKIMLYLGSIANPLTYTAVSSAEEIAAATRICLRHVKRAIDSLEDRGFVVPGEQTGPLKTIYRLFFLHTASFPTSDKMSPVANPTSDKMSPVANPTSDKMSPVANPTSDKMSPVAQTLPGMDIAKSRAQEQDSRARVDSIDNYRFDRVDRVLNAKPENFDPIILRRASDLMHSYSAKLGRYPYANPPDAMITAQFLAIDDWPRLEALIYELMAERLEPGNKPSWFVTVALNRLYDVPGDVVQNRRAQKRREKGQRPTKSAAPPEGYSAEQVQENFFQDQIKQLAKSKGMK
jgi:hypothetical protein